MRTLGRVLLPLLAVLALLAWGADSLLSATARSWYERDASTRARVAVSYAREAFVVRTAAGAADRRRLAAVLDAFARDERIMAAAACDAAGATVARTPRFPAHFDCKQPALRPPAGAAATAWAGADFASALEGEQVYVSAVPLPHEEGTEGPSSVVLVQDMSFVARREAALRRFTVGVFGVVALLASGLTVFLRRMSWRSWTLELRGLLRHGLPGRVGRQRLGAFHPLVADLRQQVSELAAEESGTGGRWSAARLQRTLATALQGEPGGVLVVANREPYIHVRAADGSIAVKRPASGLVTALEPVMRACSGTWIAHGSGDADRATVDKHDRVDVPPGEDAYTLRRVSHG